MANPNKSYRNPIQKQHSDIGHLSDRLQAQYMNARAEEDPSGCWAGKI